MAKSPQINISVGMLFQMCQFFSVRLSVSVTGFGKHGFKLNVSFGAAGR